MQLEQLPADAIEPLFADFLLGVEPIGTVVIAGAARALLDCDTAERAQTLRTFWLQRSPADFLPRAFTEGLACFMAGRGAALSSRADRTRARRDFISIHITCQFPPLTRVRTRAATAGLTKLSIFPSSRAISLTRREAMA